MGMRQKGLVDMIALENVTKRWKGKPILSDVTLSIHPGELIFLKGPNGSGKTMLLRLLCGLLDADTGTVIREDGITFGLLLETPGFFPHESALYNLNYLASIRGVIGQAEIHAWLIRFGLYEARRKQVRTFSLGMLQRLGLVQAMMERPKVILLDEPFNGLDEHNLKVAYDAIQELHQAGHTLIIATHGSHETQFPGHRLVRMEQGRLSEA